jgi:hypothetical protein
LLAWFVAGVFDRFPWKADEPYSFGIVWEMLEDHQWLIPQVADQPFVEKPPLVYWVAAAFAKAMPAVQPLESSRLAILFFAAIGVAAMYAAARRLHREMAAWTTFVEATGGPHARNAIRLIPHAYATLALLLMVGTLGYAETIHKLVADIGPACRRDPGDWWIDLDRHGRRAAVRDGCIAKSGRRWWADAGEGHRHRMRPGKRSGRFADDDRPQSRRRHNDLGAAAFRTFSGVGGRAPSRVRLQWCPSAEPAQAEPDRTRWGSDLVWTDLEVPRPRSRPD